MSVAPYIYSQHTMLLLIYNLQFNSRFRDFIQVYLKIIFSVLISIRTLLIFFFIILNKIINTIFCYRNTFMVYLKKRGSYTQGYVARKTIGIKISGVAPTVWLNAGMHRC